MWLVYKQSIVDCKCGKAMIKAMIRPASFASLIFGSYLQDIVFSAKASCKMHPEKWTCYLWGQHEWVDDARWKIGAAWVDAAWHGDLYGTKLQLWTWKLHVDYWIFSDLDRFVMNTFFAPLVSHLQEPLYNARFITIYVFYRTRMRLILVFYSLLRPKTYKSPMSTAAIVAVLWTMYRWRKMHRKEGPNWLQLLPTRHLAVFNKSQLLVDLKRDSSKAEQKVQTFSLASVAWNQSFQNELNHGRLTFHGGLVFLAPWQQFGAITTQEDLRRVASINFYNS